MAFASAGMLTLTLILSPCELVNVTILLAHRFHLTPKISALQESLFL
jgi:hypothetical protein